MLTGAWATVLSTTGLLAVAGTPAGAQAAAKAIALHAYAQATTTAMAA